MRILLAHNYYGLESPSGENNVFESERDLLISRGNEVAEFLRFSDDIRKKGIYGEIKGGLLSPWNSSTTSSIRKKIDEFKPDVVHVHNVFPLISPSIFFAIKSGVARVLTLHNYRLFCAAGVPMRNQKICTECLDLKSPFPALKYGCYRGSRIATTPLVISIELHKLLNTWNEHIDAFIVFTEFQRDLMINAGLPSHKIYIKPNFYPGNPVVVPWNERQDYVVYVGRLSAEKGVKALILAWKEWHNPPLLQIVGDGPMLRELRLLSSGLNIKFLGNIHFDNAQSKIANAKLLILPSECYEGFPMVIREAFAFGTPVAASNLGPLPSIVIQNENGILFEPGNTISINNNIRNLWNDSFLLKKIAVGARKSYETLYTESSNYEKLMNIYDAAIRDNRVFNK